ncbi:hypothetical protein [Candidatus Phytoplasma solani]|uniref:hypothetical protein n=1 Tax=Candidatus Phytoplasma solani TaxID=69896 RepID=UPI00359012A4
MQNEIDQTKAKIKELETKINELDGTNKLATLRSELNTKETQKSNIDRQLFDLEMKKIRAIGTPAEQAARNEEIAKLDEKNRLEAEIEAKIQTKVNLAVEIENDKNELSNQKNIFN